MSSTLLKKLTTIAVAAVLTASIPLTEFSAFADNKNADTCSVQGKNGGNFGPLENCKRAEIVTFLYRYANP